MKRAGLLCILGIIVLLSTTWGARHVFRDARPDGINTAPGNYIYLAQDSTDSFKVDTFSSDTIAVDTGSKWLNWYAILNDFALCDSCNDSVVIVMQLYGGYDNSMKRLLQTDTFPTSLGSLDTASDSLLNHEVLIDTFGINRAWVDMVVKDSFIQGEGTDSLTLQIHHQLLGHR